MSATQGLIVIKLAISMPRKSLNPYNFFKSLKCPAFSNLQAQRFLNVANGETRKSRHRGKWKKRRAKYQTTIIDLLLLCSGSCTLIPQSARARMFRIDVIRQFRVKVGGRSRFSPMRIVLVSIPLYSLLYSSPSGVEMGNPRNI